MSEGAEVTPEQKFNGGIKKAFHYGKVFVQGEAVALSDAARKVEAAVASNDSTVMFPDLKIQVLSEEDKSATEAISALLASLSKTSEGRSLLVHLVVPFLSLVC